MISYRFVMNSSFLSLFLGGGALQRVHSCSLIKFLFDTYLIHIVCNFSPVINSLMMGFRFLRFLQVLRILRLDRQRGAFKMVSQVVYDHRQVSGIRSQPGEVFFKSDSDRLLSSKQLFLNFLQLNQLQSIDLRAKPGIFSNYHST